MHVGALELRKNWGSHIDASHSRQPLVKGERLVRHEVNAVITNIASGATFNLTSLISIRGLTTIPPSIQHLLREATHYV